MAGLARSPSVLTEHISSIILIPFIYFILAPNIPLVWPSGIVGNRGETVSFNCSTTSKVEWFFNEGKLPSNAVVIHHENITELKVYNVSRINEGIYVCQLVDNSKYRDAGILELNSRKIK